MEKGMEMIFESGEQLLYKGLCLVLIVIAIVFKTGSHPLVRRERQTTAKGHLE
jgi:hypothetical protein